MSDNEHISLDPRGWLAWLKQRSTVVFTILLALSVMSFVHSLDMGRDIIDYFWRELGKVQGWGNFVRTCANIFHSGLELWRGLLNHLFSFLPFRIPPWLHDPISVFFFGAARLWGLTSNEAWHGKRWKEYYKGWTTIEVMRQRSSRLYSRWLIEPLLTYYIVPMVLLAAVDKAFYNNIQHGFDFRRQISFTQIAPYGVVLFCFLGLWFLAFEIEYRRSLRK